MKLHLGCGARFIPGFVHVDVADHPHVDLRCAVDRIPMIEDGAAELIYACHVLEHFPRRDTGRVLAEWFRMTRPGGTLRLAVPDFAAICEVYLGTRDLSLIVGPIFGRQDYLYNVHYTVFDEATLGDALRTAGFDNVRRWNWREVEHAGVDDYSRSYIPHMDFERGRLISLNLEATRPCV